MSLRFPLLLLAIALTALRLNAELHCPSIFADHMVLQRGKPIPVWGTATPGMKVKISFAGKEQSVTAAKDGTWSVLLPVQRASAAPRVLRIQADTTMEFTDVLVGEIWLCSGQSNMEKPIGPRVRQKPTDNWDAELAAANVPLLRLYSVARKGRPDITLPGDCWTACTPETLKAQAFSAAAYHFGRELARTLGVPVGLIHSSYGGTRIEAWTPPEAFSTEPSLASYATAARDSSKYEGVEVSGLYKSMIAPVVPYGLRGIIWYQGESNCSHADGLAYIDKMRALITGWRTVWRDRTLPFYFVHLAPYNYSDSKGVLKVTKDALPMLWEAQVKALSIPGTGLVPTLDIAPDPTDIHPTNKTEVGLRLAHLALSRNYDVRGLEPDCPRYDTMSVRKDGLRLNFSFTGRGLTTHGAKEPSQFQVAGADRVFKPASVRISGSRIILSSVDVPVPVAARYAWNEAAQAEIFNSSGLPLLPFRTDSWPLVLHMPLDTNEAPTVPAPAPASAEKALAPTPSGISPSLK